MNLTSNALRYGTTARVSVAYEDTHLRYIVEDDGPGIPAARRADALRPFIRLDAARNQNKGSGVGLGLAIADDIARRHGGSLTLGTSAAMGGLRVDLTLPR
jgi:two-component system osmolarity sensor histidine kinase EnvZ